MCTSLACRQSSNDTYCSYSFGFGAVDGTTCDSGKVHKFNSNLLI